MPIMAAAGVAAGMLLTAAPAGAAASTAATTATASTTARAGQPGPAHAVTPSDLVSPTTPADVPYALPVQLPSAKTSPSVAADAPYTPAVLNLISQLEPDNPPTEAELANASILFHGGTNTTCNNVGPTAAPTGTNAEHHAALLDRRPGREHVLRARTPR